MTDRFNPFEYVLAALVLLYGVCSILDYFGCMP
jgi:hypothetical protein